jgi:hypothetical protein
MHADMEFDGQVLVWNGSGRYKATTGLPGYQWPNKQCVANGGPIPEGHYRVMIRDRGVASDDGTGFCNLKPGWGIQTIPRGTAAGNCEPFWANWGNNRVRLEPADASTRHACIHQRSGFYLHDSTKGYSHGCIEVEGSFFTALRQHMARARGNGYYLLKVKYVPGRTTSGGTRE